MLYLILIPYMGGGAWGDNMGVGDKGGGGQEGRGQGSSGLGCPFSTTTRCLP